MKEGFQSTLINLNTIEERQKLRSENGIKLDQSRKYTINNSEITVFGVSDNIFFCYFSTNIPKVTKKTIYALLDTKEQLGNDLKNAKYLVLMIQKENESQTVGVDLVNKRNPKITMLNIDKKGIFNIDENRTVYKNRTITEQFNELKKDLAGGERELKVRYLKKFFEKQKLTEDFYAIYKTELFDKIKKNLIRVHGKSEEDEVNNFILVNLNRLLFIHFLDKKGGIFPEYDIKRGSYVSYLFHNIYKNINTEESFYNTVLKPLFFEVFNKPASERKIENPILLQEFKDLPYLNGGLFNPTSYEKNNTYFIDNIFVKSFIINIIDQFNFTITEDTPFDIKVSVDPELLGYIFENLIQDYDNSKNKKESKKDERSKGGIFYTPKIEVDFMCRQVLVEYLSKKNELKHLKPSLYELFYPEKGTREDQKYGSFNSKEIGYIFKYLEEAKVVDPACGSGAFLVGMMQVILDIENTLLQQNEALIKHSSTPGIKEIKEKSKFQRKKQLIKQSLHGVDIKPWAVEIAKLRLWLSMIIDINESVFQKESVKTKPLLPSFGFKIVQGDSLVNRIGTNLIPIHIASASMLSNKMKENIQVLTTLKNDYYENKHKDENIIKKQEKEIYEEILSNKIKRLKAQITIFENKKEKKDTNGLFGQPEFGKIYNTDNIDTKKIDKQIQDYKSQIETLTKQLEDIVLRGQIPFARGIDFSDIFTQKGGFDIVVGNPPYVRQEAIEDPTGVIKEKKDYKNLLVDAVNQDWFNDVAKYRKDKLKIGGRSDLYLYFYFRGLKLLNDDGVFTFITSNSWLDVDFGSVLQEFLIKYCPSIKVFDNQVQRSFASASVNTIMVFFDKPIIQDTEIMTGKAQFINFKKTYEESIWTETMAELDHQVINKEFEEKTIKTGEVEFIKRTNKELRAIDIDAKNLWLDGSENLGGEGLEVRKYGGNKWGGRFLKAPDIYFTILERGKNILNRIDTIAKIKFGMKTGVNDFFYFPNKVFKKNTNGEKTLLSGEKEIILPTSSFKRIIKSPKELLDNYINDEYLGYEVIWIDDGILNEGIKEYIKRGESKNYNKIKSVSGRKKWYSLGEYNPSSMICMMGYNDRFHFWKNEKYIADARLYDIYYNGDINQLYMTINNSFTYLQIELFGRANLGDGALDVKVYETGMCLISDPKKLSKKYDFKSRSVKTVFEELGFDKTKNIRSQIPNPLPDRKELDDIIFDELGLTPEERNEVYWSLGELVKARLDKAKSV